MKNDPIEAKLASLRSVEPSSAEGKKAIAKALADRSNIVAKKAAQLAANAKLTELAPDLRKAFDRFLALGAAGDKGCEATFALAAGLIELEYDEPEPYLAGVRHIQMEAVFVKKTEDTAANLRAACAMGLVNARYPLAVDELVELLTDKEWKARSGAVRALGALGSEAAYALLRHKAFIGDDQPDVLIDAYAALLSLEPERAFPLVAKRLGDSDDAVAEAAVLALSMVPSEASFEALKGKARQLGRLRRTALIALATMRWEGAEGFVRGLADEGDREAADVLRELRIS